MVSERLVSASIDGESLMSKQHLAFLIFFMPLIFGAVAFGFVNIDECPPPTAHPEKRLNYRVANSGILFYAELDRKHIVAMDKKGKVLWRRNMIDQLHSKDWLGKPVVMVLIDKPHDWELEVMKERGKKGEYVGVLFSNRQFGVIDQSDGSYTSMGND